MRSSTAIAFRALVMLICMISIPLFAIFGRDLPEVVKNLVAGRLVIRITDPNASKASSSPTAATSAVGNLASNTSSPFSESAPYRAVDSGGVTAAPQAGSSAGKTVAAAGSKGDWRADPANTATAQPAGFQVPPETRPISPAEAASRGVKPTASDPVAVSAPRPSGAAVAPVSAAARTPANDEQFRNAEARLRELGATHYMLETWGSDNNRYRFVCKMAIGGNPEVNRYFQAIEDDPWRAMEAVLQQVEAWRAQAQQ